MTLKIGIFLISEDALNNFGRSDDIMIKSMISTRWIASFMLNLNKKNLDWYLLGAPLHKAPPTMKSLERNKGDIHLLNLL